MNVAIAELADQCLWSGIGMGQVTICLERYAYGVWNEGAWTNSRPDLKISSRTFPK